MCSKTNKIKQEILRKYQKPQSMKRNRNFYQKFKTKNKLLNHLFEVKIKTI